MPRNLYQKIITILEDGDTLNRSDVARRFERLINEELQFKDSEHMIDTYDLSLVRSRAIQIYNSTQLVSEELGRIKGDSEYIRTKCFIEATVELFRKQGLINFTTVFNGKK